MDFVSKTVLIQYLCDRKITANKTYSVRVYSVRVYIDCIFNTVYLEILDRNSLYMYIHFQDHQYQDTLSGSEAQHDGHETGIIIDEGESEGEENYSDLESDSNQESESGAKFDSDIDFSATEEESIDSCQEAQENSKSDVGGCCSTNTNMLVFYLDIVF